MQLLCLTAFFVISEFLKIVVFDFSKARNSSQKVENSMDFQIFLMAAHLFLFIHDVPYAHIRQHKKILCCTKNCCVKQNKYFT